MADITLTTLAKLGSDANDNTIIRILIKIANILEVNLDDLTGRSEHKKFLIEGLTAKSTYGIFNIG